MVGREDRPLEDLDLVAVVLERRSDLLRRRLRRATEGQR
jgi:hypothetical protein